MDEATSDEFQKGEGGPSRFREWDADRGGDAFDAAHEDPVLDEGKDVDHPPVY